MQYLLTFLLCFQIVFTTAQVEIIDIFQEKGDTIFSEKRIETENGKISEIRYTRSIEYEGKYWKEDLSIRGLKPFGCTDSIRLYEYDADWKILATKVLRERKSIAEYRPVSYSSEEFQLTENTIYITGRTNEEKKVIIGLQNLTAQDFFIEIRRKGESVLIQEPFLVKNRSTKTIKYDVKFSAGSKEIFLNLKNSNGKTRDLKIQMIGYDLTPSNFVSKKDLKKRKTITLKAGKDIFMDVSGNTKLLTIKNRKRELNIPTSKILTRLEGDSLAKGKYIFELQNLGTNEKRYCRVKIE